MGMEKKQKKEATREGKIMMTMHHPNVVQVQETYRAKNDKIIIIMEFCDGGTLQ